MFLAAQQGHSELIVWLNSRSHCWHSVRFLPWRRVMFLEERTPAMIFK